MKKVLINDEKSVKPAEKGSIIENIKAYIAGTTSSLEQRAREVWDADEILSSTDANYILIRLTELNFIDSAQIDALEPITGDTITAHVCLFFKDVI